MTDPAKQDSGVTAMCVYRVKAGEEDAFENLLGRHWPTLRSLELVSDTPPLIYRGAESDGAPFFVEFLSWLEADSPANAHQLPEVAAIWEPMGMLCESRGGHPPMEFPVVEKIDIHQKR